MRRVTNGSPRSRRSSSPTASLGFVALALVVAACGGQTTSKRATPDGPGTGGAGGAPGAGLDGGSGGSPTWDFDAGALAGTLEERSGTRLQVIDWFSGDTPVTRKELRDAEKDVPCEIARADDGVFRCLPVSQGGRVLFLDARCTEPVIAWNSPTEAGCPEPRSSYVTYPAFSSCPEPRTLVAVRGSAILPPPKLYANLGTDNCSPGAGPGQPLYEAVASPPGDWVAFAREVVPEGPDLGVEMFQGGDGSRVRGTLRYSPDDLECTPTGSDGTWPAPHETSTPAYCAPAHPISVGPWTTDPGCAYSGGVIASPKCDPEPFAYDVPANGGGLVRSGPLVDNSKIWLPLLGTCGQVGASMTPDTVFHEPGSPVALTSFPRLDFARSAAGSVEQHGWTAGAGGPLLPEDGIGWSDAAAGSRGTCTPVLFAEGTVLCAPPDTGFSAWSGFTLTVAHADPGCTLDSMLDVFAVVRQQVPFVPEVGQWIITAPPTRPGPPPSAECMSDGVEVRQITARHQGPAYGMVFGACILLDDTGWFVADLGPPRPAKDVLPHLDARAL